jgi:hypothetical protein
LLEFLALSKECPAACVDHPGPSGTDSPTT